MQGDTPVLCERFQYQREKSEEGDTCRSAETPDRFNCQRRHTDTAVNIRNKVLEFCQSR